MADITMCTATLEACPLAETCYRTSAQQSEHRQSWFVDVPYREGNGCAYYTPAAVSRVRAARRRLTVVP